MNRKFYFFMFFFLLCYFFLPFLKLNAGPELPFDNALVQISLDFKDAPMKDILKIFAVQSGLNFVSSEGVQDRRVTLYLDKVPIKDAMDKIFKANNLSYELDRNANIFIVKDLGPSKVETVTRVFYLKNTSVGTSALLKEKNADSSSSTTDSSTSSLMNSSTSSSSTGQDNTGKPGITRAVEKLLSDYGSVIEDYRTNSLIVTDVPTRMPVIAKTIAELDLPVPQVLLEVEMLDVSKNTVDKIGIKFGQTPLTLNLTGAAMSTPWPFLDSMYKNKTFAKTFTPGNASFATAYQVLLDFLRTQTDTKYLARPRILTLNNETAEIKIATNEAIGVKTTAEASSGTTSAEPERAETGVILKVTPQINIDSGEITMCVYPKVAEATTGSAITQGGFQYIYKDPEERSTKTMVRIKDGDTVVIGGLIRNEFTQVTTKLPFLGDIPYIGKLFTHKGGTNDKDKTRELLIFITPHIVRESGNKLAKAEVSPASIPEREQGTASNIPDREKAINTSLNEYSEKFR